MPDDAPLPLFVLGTVLFPGMVLPLKVFEPRYRLMLERALEGDRRFGVVLEDEASPLGHARVGTVYELGACEAMPNGQYLIAGVGGQRFRVRQAVEGEAYRQALVDWLPLDDPDESLGPEASQGLREELERYVAGLATLHHWTVRLPQGDLSPGEWAFVLAAALQVDAEQKQALLERDPAAARFAHARDLLREEGDRLEAFLARARERGDFFHRGNRFSKN